MAQEDHIKSTRIPIRGELLTISNLFSFSRAFIPIPIIALHHAYDQQPTTGIILLLAYAVLSDFLDGYFARKFNQITEFGKVMDPLADKICAFIIFFYIVYLGFIPYWFFSLLVVRDALILGGSLWIKKRKGEVFMSVMSGKVAVNALTAYGVAAFFFPGYELLIAVLKWTTAGLLVYSFGVYLQRFLNVWRGTTS